MRCAACEFEGDWPSGVPKWVGPDMARKIREARANNETSGLPARIDNYFQNGQLADPVRRDAQ